MNLQLQLDQLKEKAQGKYDALQYAIACQYDLNLIKEELKIKRKQLDKPQKDTIDESNFAYWIGYEAGLDEAINIITNPSGFDVLVPTSMFSSEVSKLFKFALLPSEGLVEAFKFAKTYQNDLVELKQEITEKEASVIQRLCQGDFTSFATTPIVYQLCYLAGLRYALQILGGIRQQGTSV